MKAAGNGRRGVGTGQGNVLPGRCIAVLLAGCAALSAQPAFTAEWRVLSRGVWDRGGYPEQFGRDFPVLDIPHTDGEFRAADVRLIEAKRNLYMHADALAFLDEPSGVESEHTPWLRPISGGPVSILYVANPGARNREIIELQQRVDCRIRTLFVPISEFWERYPNASEFMRERQLRALEHPVDVVVLNHSRHLFEVLDEAFWERLTGLVEAGTGLVVLYGDSEALPDSAQALSVLVPGARRHRETVSDSTATDHPVVRGIDMRQVYAPGHFSIGVAAEDAVALMTREEGRDCLVAAGRHGDGRVVGIAHMLGVRSVGMPEENGLQYRYWEQYFAIQARAVAWAAGRLEQTRLSVAVDAAASPATVGVSVDGPETLLGPARVEITVSDDEHAVEMQTTRALDEAASVPMHGVVRSGLKIVDVRLLDETGSVIDFASASFSVSEPALELRVDPAVVAAGGTVTFELTGWRAAGDAWRLRIHDSYGRLVGSLRSETDGAAYVVEEPRGILFRVTADVVDASGTVAARRRGFFTVPRYGTDDYHNYFWPSPQAPYFQDALYRLYQSVGVNGVYLPPWSGTDSAWFAAAGRGGMELWGGNLCAVAGRAPVEEDRLVYPPRSPQWYDRFLDMRALPASKRLVGQFGVGHVSLQDEGHQHNETSFDEWTLNEFRGALRSRYGELAALNAHWKTDFEDWDNVRPLKTAEMHGRLNFAPWLEFRRFMDAQMALAMGEIAETLREVTGVDDLPIGVEGIFGFSGHHVPYGLYDYAMLSEAGLNAISPYISEFAQIPGGAAYAFDLIKGLGQDHMSVGWINANNDPWMHAMIPWWGLFHGGSGTSYYIDSSYVSSMGAILPRAELIEGVTRPLREGVGKLVMESERYVDPVAVYFNMGNFQLSWIIDRSREERVWYNRLVADGKASIERILQDIGITPGWLTDGMIADGGLDGYRLVILTGALGLSVRTIEALETFVQNGGVVVADGVTGMYDETGRPAPADRLRNLFGVIRRDATVKFQPAQYSLGLTKTRGSDIFPFLPAEWLKAGIVETGLEADGSTPLGAHVEMSPAPAFFARRMGDGRTLYINGVNTTYVNDADDRDLNVWRGLLLSCGILPPAGVYGSGDVLNYYDVKAFRAGAAFLAGVIRSPRFGAINPLEVEVRFPEDGFIYNVVSGESAGAGRRANVVIRPGQPVLLASLPAEVSGIVLEAPGAASAGSVAVVSVRVLPAGNADTVVRLTVTGPDGIPEPALSGNYSAPGGESRIRLPFALDAVPGAWTLEVKDVISGVSDAVRVDVH